MSGRYSLRATPRKKELFDGMVETPAKTRSSRRQSSFPPEASDNEDDAAATPAPEKTPARSRSVRRRTLAKSDDEPAQNEQDHGRCQQRRRPQALRLEPQEARGGPGHRGRRLEARPGPQD
ncbi:hypothetical protein NLG97_g6684 [Lecanicillium saksenae]|uniref:Uncharacterized protein n=1 Tax=Lecanicillium saksenae TaxID=468837 RepID=A0ACC1QRA4_9HYPO|nr:hypothetical protein NLG97_g6684 [Lecanicillium saksenae]